MCLKSPKKERFLIIRWAGGGITEQVFFEPCLEFSISSDRLRREGGGCFWYRKTHTKVWVCISVQGAVMGRGGYRWDLRYSWKGGWGPALYARLWRYRFYSRSSRMPSKVSEQGKGESSLGYRPGEGETWGIRWAHGLHTGQGEPELSKEQGWESDTHLWAAGLLPLLLVNRQDQDAPEVRDYSPLYMHLSFVLPVFQILFSLSHEVYPGLQSWRTNSNSNNQN